MVTVQNVYDALDEIAAFALQASDDNSGLIIGDFAAEVKKVLICCDVHVGVVNEAVEKGADLIIAHHPVIYIPAKNVFTGTAVHMLAANGINVIAVHTNLDVADGGVSDMMIERLGFSVSGNYTVIEAVGADGAGFGRVFEVDMPVTAAELAGKCKSAFNCTAVRFVDGGKPISKIGLCSGGGDSLTAVAFEMGCDAYICGDVRWHNMIFAYDSGKTLIDAGHFHTEDIFCDVIVGKLKRRFDGVCFAKADNSVDVCRYV